MNRLLCLVIQIKTSMNAITSLRSGKVLPNIVPTKENKIEEPIGNHKLDDKTSESISMPETGREQLIPFPNAFTKKEREYGKLTPAQYSQ